VALHCYYVSGLEAALEPCMLEELGSLGGETGGQPTVTIIHIVDLTGQG
jgi:hypothetical protein